jgi:hypothetical protein
MTTVIESQYHFTAEVKSKGKQQGRDGWAMVVDWKLPGSQFDLTLYGQDWETVGDVVIDEKGQGPLCIFTIQQGNLKKNKDGTIKDGRYSTDYWWDIVSIEPTWIAGDGEKVASDEAPPVQAPPPPKPNPAPPARTQWPPEHPGPVDRIEQPPAPPNPAALGACHNHAVDFIVRGVLPIPEGRELFGWVRELRDRFYREINQAPVMPLHYCYQHDQERRQGPDGGWGHILPKQADGDENSYCIEGREGWRTFDASQR